MEVGLFRPTGRAARLEKAGGSLSLPPLLLLPSHLLIPSGILTAFWGRGAQWQKLLWFSAHPVENISKLPPVCLSEPLTSNDMFS